MVVFVIDNNKKGRYKTLKGKMTAEQWVEIMAKMASGERVAALAKEYGITRQAIYQKKLRENNGDLP